jgi:hypothetical protein
MGLGNLGAEHEKAEYIIFRGKSRVEAGGILGRRGSTRRRSSQQAGRQRKTRGRVDTSMCRLQQRRATMLEWLHGTGGWPSGDAGLAPTTGAMFLRHREEQRAEQSTWEERRQEHTRPSERATETGELVRTVDCRYGRSMETGKRCATDVHELQLVGADRGLKEMRAWSRTEEQEAEL